MTSEVTLICHLLNARVLIWKISYREKTDGKNWDLFPNKEEKSQRVKHCTLILLPRWIHLILIQLVDVTRPGVGSVATRTLE